MPQNVDGHMTLASGQAIFLKILRGHVRTVPENMRVRVKFEVLG